MTQMTTSGKILRETRERKGYDLTTVARRLRIRPDILRAIEAGDFNAMPPRGYTRNMVNAYARLLGLNPTEIVNMYLDEVYAAQVEKARDRAPSSGFNMERQSRLGRSRGRAARQVSEGRLADKSGSSGRDSIGAARSDGRYSRMLYDDRTKYSRDDYGITREHMDRPGRSDRDFLSHHSGYTSTNFSFLDNESRGGRTVHVGQTPMEYRASRLPGFLQSRLIIGALIAVLIVIALIVVFVLLGNRNAPADDDVAKLPVSGINDTTGTADDESSLASVEVAPTSSHVIVSVKQGNEAYIDYKYDDGDMSEEHLVGPTERAFEITGKFTMLTWTPDTLSVTVDGQPVTLVNDEATGLYACSVDFPAILEQWRSTHTSREAQRSAAVANAESSANTSSSQSAQSETSASGSQ